MKPTRVAPLVQLLLLAMAGIRADWALWAFALIVYSTVLMRILESLFEDRTLPWAPAQILAIPAHLCISGAVPVLGAVLVGCTLHRATRESPLGRSALVSTLLAASGLWVASSPPPVVPGIRSDPVALVLCIWIGLGVAGRGVAEGCRLLASPGTSWMVGLGCGVPVLALAHPGLATRVFDPQLYGAFLFALALMSVRTTGASTRSGRS